MASAPPYDPSIDYAALGLGPDTPDQNYLQQSAPAQTPGPTDLLGQVDPNAQTVQAPNVMQAMPNPNVPNPQIPPVGQGPQQIGGMSALPSGQPAMQPPRQRASLLDFLGGLGDRINAGTGNRTVGQRQLAYQTAQQGADINNQEKLADLAQTRVATQQNANQITNSFANGLKAARDAGQDIGSVAPALAQQLGIPLPQANAIVAQEKANPGFIDRIAAATETAASKANAGKSLALAFTPMMNTKTGKVEMIQAGADGLAHPLDGYTAAPDLKYVDDGVSITPHNPKTNAVAGAPIIKSGAIEAGDSPIIGTDAHGLPIVTGYKPIGTGAKDKHTAAVQTETDKTAKDNQAKAATETAYQSARAGLQGFDADLARISSDPRLAGALGVKGGVMKNIPGTDAANMHAEIDQAYGKSTIDAINNLRGLSGNNTLGFRLSQQELKVFGDAESTLHKTNVSYPEYVSGIVRTRSALRGALQRLDAAHARANPSASGFTVVEH